MNENGTERKNTKELRDRQTDRDRETEKERGEDKMVVSLRDLSICEAVAFDKCVLVKADICALVQNILYHFVWNGKKVVIVLSEYKGKREKEREKDKENDYQVGIQVGGNGGPGPNATGSPPA